MSFVVVAGGVTAADGARANRVVASLCAGSLCGAATFSIALLVQTADTATSSSGLGYYAGFWRPWWWLIVGSAILALGVITCLGCALRNRLDPARKRLAYETGNRPTIDALCRLPQLGGRGVRPKIFPETLPREQKEYTSEQCESAVELPAESQAGARVMLISLARLVLLLSIGHLSSGIILLGWMYGWVWIRACESELRWIFPTLDCHFSHSGSGSMEANSEFNEVPLPSDWIASNVDTLLLAFLQVATTIFSVSFNAIVPACMLDSLTLVWIVAKGCIFTAAIAEENAVGLVWAAIGDKYAPMSSSISHGEYPAAVWAPQRAAFLCVGLLVTSTHLALLLNMRQISISLRLWRQRARRYRALQGWSPARAGWNINGDLEFVAGDVLLIVHEESMYEELDAREFDLLPFQYAEIENRPRLCRCCLAQYRTKGGAVPMRLMEIILSDNSVKPDRSVERLVAEISAAATEKTVDIMIEQSSYRPTQTVKTHPAARPHSAHSSDADTSDYGTYRSDSSRPVSAPSQRLAVRRALSTVMRQAERDEVSRATAQTAAESDALHSTSSTSSVTDGNVPSDTVDSVAQDRQKMMSALASEAKAKPFGPGGELPGLAQHSIAISASEIAGGVAQPFTRVMDTSQTLADRFGPSLDDPFARPRSASARIASAGVVAVSMQGLRHELKHGVANRKPAGVAGSLRSVRHRPVSAGPGGGTRLDNAQRSGSSFSTRRPLSARDSVKALQLFDRLIADSCPPPLPGWTQHQDEYGATYWYNIEDGIVTYTDPILAHRWTLGRHRLRRADQQMRPDGISRPFSAAARVNTLATDAVPRPHSAAARLQNSPSQMIRPVALGPSLGVEHDENLTVEQEEWMIHRQKKIEQKLATVDLQANQYRVTPMERDNLPFAQGDEVSDASEASSSSAALEAVCGGLVEEGKGWQVPVDPGLREYWGTAAGGGAGIERPQDIATIFRDVQACRDAVTKAMFDTRWRGSPDISDDRVVSRDDLYEYRDVHNGAAMYMAKVHQVPDVPDDCDSGKSTLDIAVAEWLGSIHMGHHAHVLASLGTTFADFESLTAGDLFAAGIEQPDEISAILTRLRARVPDIRVLPRPVSRTASHGSRGVARPGSAHTVERSFAETQRSMKQPDPDPAIVSALIDQGIDPATARRAAAATIETHSIEAAVAFCLEKRPQPVLCPVDGMFSISVSRVTGVQQPNHKSHGTIRIRCGVKLIVDVEEESSVTWSTAMPLNQGVVAVGGRPVRYQLRKGSKPVVRLTLARSRKSGDQHIGTRDFELCRSIGPRWTPDVELWQRFRVHDSEWGNDLAIEVALTYNPDRNKCTVTCQ